MQLSIMLQTSLSKLEATNLVVNACCCVASMYVHDVGQVIAQVVDLCGQLLGLLVELLGSHMPPTEAPHNLCIICRRRNAKGQGESWGMFTHTACAQDTQSMQARALEAHRLESTHMQSCWTERA